MQHTTTRVRPAPGLATLRLAMHVMRTKSIENLTLLPTRSKPQQNTRTWHSAHYSDVVCYTYSTCSMNQICHACAAEDNARPSYRLLHDPGLRPEAAGAELPAEIRMSALDLVCMYCRGQSKIRSPVGGSPQAATHHQGFSAEAEGAAGSNTHVC